jgi:hypothetical protein
LFSQIASGSPFSCQLVAMPKGRPRRQRGRRFNERNLMMLRYARMLSQAIVSAARSMRPRGVRALRLDN